MPKKRALISVYFKNGVADLARALDELGYEIISTSRTAQVIREAGISVIEISDLTEFPELLGGRVKTLHPAVFAGILARLNNEADMSELEAYDIKLIDLVVCNLYPFAQTVADEADADKPDTVKCIEMIDIGGITLLRAAAKNYDRVGVVMDPSDYPMIIDEMREHGGLLKPTRLHLAVKAFAAAAQYDLEIASWMSDGDIDGMIGEKVRDSAYGENPWIHDSAVFRRFGKGSDDVLGLPEFRIVGGRSPSHINYTDMGRALQTLTHMAAEHELNCQHQMYICVGIKHNSPCGVGLGNSPIEAIRKMIDCNPLSIFGAVVMTNFKITDELAHELVRYNYESKGKRPYGGICAPGFDDASKETLSRLDNMCFLAVNPMLATIVSPKTLDDSPIYSSVRGGFLRQGNFTNIIDIVTADKDHKLNKAQTCDMATGIAVCGTSTSNTLVAVANGIMTSAVGQQDRVGCCELLLQRGTKHNFPFGQAVVVSDSFFPFTDGPEVLINAGVPVIFSTTGSVRDKETRELCESRGTILVQLPDKEARMFYGHAA